MSNDAEKYSVFKALAILLAICLVGVTWLHLWYTEKLKQELAQHAEQITDRSERLAQADQRIGLLGKTEAGLRSDISDLNAELATANATSAQLRGDIEELQTAHAADVAELQDKHAATLAAEQHKAAEAYAALSARFDSANDQIASLESDIRAMQAAADEVAGQHRLVVADLQQQMADATAAHDQALAARDASHEQATQQLEAELSKRIAFYKTALEGDEPERAAQLVAIEEETAALRSAVEDGKQQIGGLETSLAETSDKLLATEASLAQSDQQLQAAQQDLAATRQQLSDSQNTLSNLQAEYDNAKQAAAAALADSQEALRLANEEHVSQAAAAAALLEETREEAAATLARTQSEAAEQLARTQAEAAEVLASTKAQAADLLARTQAEAAAELEKTRADAESAMQAAVTTAAAAMAEAKAQHGSEMNAANQRIGDLESSLASEQAALASLQREYAEFSDTKAAELAALEQDLRDTRGELDRTKTMAAETKASLEGRIADAESMIADLKQQAVLDRQQAAEQQARAIADLRNMYRGFDELGATRTENGMLLNLGGKELNFRVGQAELRYDELPSLDTLAAFLNANPALSARIEGHTDSSGRDQTNLELSQARAETVMRALGERGVDVGRLSAEGIGEARPVADNETQYGRFLNRRVEIYITGY